MKLIIFILLLLNVSIVYGADQCTLAKARRVNCDHLSSPSRKQTCYNEMADALQSHCLDQNPLDEGYRKARNALLGSLREKYRQADSPERSELNNIRRAWEQLSGHSLRYQSRFNEQAALLRDFAEDIDANFAPSFSVFSAQLGTYIQQSRDAQTSLELAAVIHNIRTLISKESHTTQVKMADLAVLRLGIDRLEQQFITYLNQFTPREDLDPNGEVIAQWEEAVRNLTLDSDVLDAMDDYLHDRYEKISAKSQQLLDMLDQKLIALINQETQTEVGERLQDSIFLRRSADFLAEVNQVIDTFKQRERSDFNGFQYQQSYLKNAQSVLELIAFCDSSEAAHWQSLGCHTAKSSRTAASRAGTSTVPNAIRFGLRVLKTLGDETPQPDLQVHIETLLEQDRIEEAAIFFDQLLDQAGGQS